MKAKRTQPQSLQVGIRGSRSSPPLASYRAAKIKSLALGLVVTRERNVADGLCPLPWPCPCSLPRSAFAAQLINLSIFKCVCYSPWSGSGVTILMPCAVHSPQRQQLQQQQQ